ncbi:PREDICTED: protein FAM161A [Polistes dominula]|uniref:Protein FAM161A n=1 Tax=Polistes dominula TaxID=743375 RepID=A0ABM1HT35_POLDO|nr:PREDICTED: protein FAM161A [Polistes dominula]XP_015171122.1 PREDICTED: protein FAM161A [Polistes dominula]
MAEHRGTSFYNSCVKVPIDPCSRQPTPSYERPRSIKSEKQNIVESKGRKINFASEDLPKTESELSSPRENLEDFLEFLESIPDYTQVNHLSNEQFRQKVEYLRRKQRLFLKNLTNNFDETEKDTLRISTSRSNRNIKVIRDDINELRLNGKKCYIEESRTNSPILYPSGSFAGLMEDQDLLTFRYKDKEAKATRNKEIHTANKEWNTWSESKSNESLNNDSEDSVETKSLPASSPKEWHPTVPKPFSFTLREEAEKYMTLAEMEAVAYSKKENNKKGFSKKRRVRPIPLTSKIPLYDKLLAEKEERSRIVREESALNLLSQVRPFKLECDRRAWRSLTRSSPEICSKNSRSTSRFKAKPVPKNLFGTEVYDRMLEDEYYRELTKKVRASELMRSSSLPPSMARRERVKSACANLQNYPNDSTKETIVQSRESSRLSNLTTMTSERSRSALNSLPSRGNNLAAVLRCQASREKLEREIRERMDEKRREQVIKLKENLIGRKPAWRALRSATRHDHERDLDIRTSMRRNEAREQAERHRLQMEMMLDRVTQIPTLFERHSQSFQSLTKLQRKNYGTNVQRKKKKRINKRDNNSGTDSYLSYCSNSRPNSGSFTSSSTIMASSSQSSKSSESKESDKSLEKLENSGQKKKGYRGPLKVSIKETAELIEDKLSSDRYSDEEEHEEDVLRSNHHTPDE